MPKQLRQYQPTSASLKMIKTPRNFNLTITEEHLLYLLPLTMHSSLAGVSLLLAILPFISLIQCAPPLTLSTPNRPCIPLEQALAYNISTESALSPALQADPPMYVIVQKLSCLTRSSITDTLTHIQVSRLPHPRPRPRHNPPIPLHPSPRPAKNAVADRHRHSR